jgi:hypothetical protein
MLVLSGVFNTRILDAMNYGNQDYMRVNYTLIVVYTMLLVTGSQSKNVNHCASPSIGQTWVFASIGAVVEMGVLSTLKRLLGSLPYGLQTCARSTGKLDNPFF